jgi:signal transduction histidine kinase
MSWFDILIEVILHYGIVFALGYAFQLAVLTHKQGQVIKEQNRILEQHVTQVEQMTLVEERNRLSKELHDTIGHTLTSLIMGMESLRQAATGDQTERIDALLRSARSGLEEVRTHLHQMSSSTLPASFTTSLQKLVSKFKDTTRIEVKFRTLGEEYAVPNPIKLTLYRCLQEALTNAARHGQATAIEVHLHFEANQLRLQIQDNGVGNESRIFR